MFALGTGAALDLTDMVDLGRNLSCPVEAASTFGLN